MTSVTMTPNIQAGSVGAGVQHHGSRLRITRRGRIVLLSLISLPIVAAALAFSLNGGMASATLQSGNASDFTYVTVAAGQSLWSLAESVDPTADPRDVIAQIVRLNQLPTADIEPGQRLAIPAS